MATETEQLVVQLEARIRDFEKNFERANKTASDNWSKIEARGKQATDRIQSDLAKAANSIGGTLKGIAASFGSSVGLTGLGLSAMLATAVQVNGELAKIEGLAKRAGLSTDRLQEVKFAANLKGVSNEDFAAGIDQSLRLLDEAQRQVNDLRRLFNANGLAIKNQNGDLLKFDELLERAAQLMAGAKTEQNKAKIAEMLGLSRDWIRVLEGGPEAFRKSAQEARDAGAVIDRDVIAKAKEFDRQWQQAIVRFKAGMVDGLADLAKAFGEFWQNLIDDVPGVSFMRDTMERWFGGIRGMTIPELKEAIAESIRQGVGDEEVARLQAELDRRLGNKPLRLPALTVTTDQPETVIPKERERNPFERAVNEANKRIAVIGAETQAVGQLSEARDRARLVAELEEAAKRANTEAGFQNARVTDEQRAKINQLADAMFTAAQKQRQAQSQFESWNETLKFSGSLAVDFFDALGEKAKSFADIMKSAMSMVKRALLSALIMGEGPLAGILGLKSPVSGGTGGLLGAVFGGAKADGGMIRGPGGPRSDNIIARVSNGEFVVNAAATSRHLRLLEAINSNAMPRFADGGLVGSFSAPSVSAAAGPAITVAPTINIQGGSRGPAADAQLAKTITQQMEGMIRALAAKELRTQMRPGGLLGRG